MTSPSSPGLEGLRAVVTGSTSGIGRATAVALAAAGADVVIHGRDRDRGAEVAEAVHQWKRNAIVDVTDLSDEPALSDFVQRVWAQGRVDIWVNNAGVDVLTGEASQLDFVAKLARLWAVDVRATIMLSRDVGRRMHAAGGGVIINMGWDQASTGMAGDSGEMFAATKGAVEAFSRSLAKSLAPRVRVNCVAPGWIRTAWGETASPEWQARAQGESLLERWGTPDDVAQAVCFLASPVASFVNGQVLAVNGGRGDAWTRPADGRPAR